MGGSGAVESERMEMKGRVLVLALALLLLGMVHKVRTLPLEQGEAAGVGRRKKEEVLLLLLLLLLEVGSEGDDEEIDAAVVELVHKEEGARHSPDPCSSRTSLF